jgi:ArsR family transcriptional regulator
MEMLEKIARILRGCADPTRLRILSLLQGGPLCVCDLVAILGLSQPLVSRHCAVLRNAQMVSAKRWEKWMVYTLLYDNPLIQNLLATILSPQTRSPQMERDLNLLNARIKEGLCSARSHRFT